jgi:hypothetical protein
MKPTLTSSNPDRDATLVAISDKMSQTNPLAALLWLAQYQNEPGYDVALKKVYTNWLYKAPGPAMRQALTIKRNRATHKQSTIAYLVLRWLKLAPQDCIKWVSALDAGDNRDHLISTIVGVHWNDDLEQSKQLIGLIANKRLQDMMLEDMP